MGKEPNLENLALYQAYCLILSWPVPPERGLLKDWTPGEEDTTLPIVETTQHSDDDDEKL
jgi:hypothetical protein